MEAVAKVTDESGSESFANANKAVKNTYEAFNGMGFGVEGPIWDGRSVEIVLKRPFGDCSLVPEIKAALEGYDGEGNEGKIEFEKNRIVIHSATDPDTPGEVWLAAEALRSSEALKAAKRIEQATIALQNLF